MNTPIMIMIISSQACIFPMRVKQRMCKDFSLINGFLSWKDKGKDTLKIVPFLEGKEKHQNTLWHQSCTETPATNGKEMPASEDRLRLELGNFVLKREGGCGAWWAQRNQLARAVRRWLTGRTRKPAFVPAPLRSPTEPAQRHTRIQRIQRWRQQQR